MTFMRHRLTVRGPHIDGGGGLFPMKGREVHIIAPDAQGDLPVWVDGRGDLNADVTSRGGTTQIKWAAGAWTSYEITEVEVTPSAAEGKVAP